MRIGVIANTRGRERLLNASLTALENLSSGCNEIFYAVRVDSDDIPSAMVMQSLHRENPRFAYLVGERTPTLGGSANEAAKALPQCDVYTIWHTATFPLTVNWDAAIAAAVKHEPIGVFWWQSPGNDSPTLCAFGRKWYEARGCVYTEHFPFWFDDTWLAELSLFVHGAPLKGLQCAFSQRRGGKTNRLRDLAFWYEFFSKTRAMRIEQAMEICERLGKEFPDPAGVIARLEAGDSDVIARADEIQAAFGSDPIWPGDEQYFAAKKRAEEYLTQTYGPRVDDLSEWPLNFDTAAA